MTANEVMEEVLENITILIKRNGITGKEFAKKIGRRHGIVSDWKLRRSSPSLTDIVNICEAFNCSLYDLFPLETFGSKDASCNPHLFNGENKCVSEDSKSIGARIQARRSELHITQAQVYNLTGISSGNLSGIEKGKNLPSAPALISLSRVLNCSIDWILTGKPSVANSLMLDLPSTEKNLIFYYRRMQADDQDELIAIAKMKYSKVGRKEAAD